MFHAWPKFAMTGLEFLKLDQFYILVNIPISTSHALQTDSVDFAAQYI